MKITPRVSSTGMALVVEVTTSLRSLLKDGSIDDDDAVAVVVGVAGGEDESEREELIACLRNPLVEAATLPLSLAEFVLLMDFFT